jgi:hypothetical protein
MASALTLLEYQDSNEFLHHTIRVTGDATFVLFVNVESEEQSKQWMHAHSPNKHKKFKQTLFARKLMATVFWNMKTSADSGIHATRATEVYRETLKKLCTVSHSK